MNLDDDGAVANLNVGAVGDTVCKLPSSSSSAANTGIMSVDDLPHSPAASSEQESLKTLNEELNRFVGSMNRDIFDQATNTNGENKGNSVIYRISLEFHGDSIPYMPPENAPTEKKIENIENVDLMRKVSNALTASYRAIRTRTEADIAAAQKQIVSTTVDVVIETAIAEFTVGNSPEGKYIQREIISHAIEPGVERLNSFVTDVRVGISTGNFDQVEVDLIKATAYAGLRIVEPMRDIERLLMPKTFD